MPLIARFPRSTQARFSPLPVVVEVVVVVAGEAAREDEGVVVVAELAETKILVAVGEEE